MNKINISKKFWPVLVLSLVIFMQSTNAFARPDMGGAGGSHRGPQTSSSRRQHYRYHDGRFYHPIFFGLFEILVNVPPIGGIVTVLPAGHRRLIIGGTTYYYYDNVYYADYPTGYVVVPAPVANSSTVVAPAIVIQPSKIYGETATINVPDSNGSYTPVTLVKQKEGYLGPQGEYYPGHPTVEQLKVLYGK
jgi:hypothetical protein